MSSRSTWERGHPGLISSRAVLPTNNGGGVSNTKGYLFSCLFCLLTLMIFVQCCFYRIVNVDEYITYWDHASDRFRLRSGLIDIHKPQIIPRVIYQTWYTRDLHPKVQETRQNMRKINPGYEFKLFLDSEMDDFVKHNFEQRVVNAYMKLNIITAKADFWRYLVLYKNGGVYLDMDSAIIKPLASLINEKDEAIITMQEWQYETVFGQWALIFAPNHPILNRTIEYVVDNILNHKMVNSTLTLTGPIVYTKAIQNLHLLNFGNYFRRALIRSSTDITYNVQKPVQSSYRVFGIDFNKFFRVKFMDRILNDKKHTHWRDEERMGKAPLKDS